MVVGDVNVQTVQDEAVNGRRLSRRRCRFEGADTLTQCGAEPDVLFRKEDVVASRVCGEASVDAVYLDVAEDRAVALFDDGGPAVPEAVNRVVQSYEDASCVVHAESPVRDGGS